MITGKEIAWVLAAYVLGCFTAGYYWVRWRSGKDLRHEGSGSLGARNAGRVLGYSGFLVTLAIDFLKGAAVVQAAWWMGLRPEAVVATLMAVVMGHNWPVQLRFHGGKGIAVSLGGLLAYDYFTLVVLATLFFPLWIFTRSFTLSGMLAYSLAPLMVFLSGVGPLGTFAMSATAMLVVLAHRKNIREELTRLMADEPANQAATHPPEGDAT